MMETRAATLATRREVTPVSNRMTNRDGERYELLGELATGGMATVYLGRMRRPMGFARLVAIKCMHPQYAKDPSFASMFLDEARLTARLRHPNIVPTLDIVADGGHLLIVMEYVEGESLSGLLRLVRDAADRIPVAVACAIIHDLLLGLHEAHEARDDDGSPLAIIHRDVSPQNVIVGLDGLSRVLDFGVAKARSRVHHSNEGEIKGKIPYMPPEQLFGEAVDRRVDIYAAGVLLWEALVGQRLFDGSSEESIVRRIDAGEIAAPSTKVAGISPELDALVLRALCKEPDGRFPTALAMAEALSSIATLPPRTEISAWMKRFSKPRSIPADAIGTSIELASESVSPDELVAVLERATIASRPSFAPVSSSGPRVPPPSASRFAMVIGVAGFALAGVLVGRAMRAETAHAETARHVASPPAAPIADPIAPAAPLAATTPSEPSEPSEPAPTPAPVVKGLRKAGRPSAPANPSPAVKPAADATPVVSTPDPKPTSCRLPYVVDAEGHRHYKVECL
jgi:eukaryotic-like serine/threonine-protein kinase